MKVRDYLLKEGILPRETGLEQLFPRTLKKIVDSMKRNNWNLKIETIKAGMVWLNWTRPEGPEGAQLDSKAVLADNNWDNRRDGTYIYINCYNFAGMPNKAVAEMLAGELRTAGLKAKAGKFKKQTVVLIFEEG